MNKLCALLLALLACAAHAEAPPTAALDAALTEARERHAPVLVDFHAPWCYSCYYMKKNVLNGPQWQKVERETVVLELDADAPEGAHWRERWNVKALPSYVVLNEQGEELGRITAEQTRADFYRQLGAITARQSTLTELQQAAARGGAPGLAATVEVLLTYHARRDAAAGLAWFAALPESLRASTADDRAVNAALQRLRLQQVAAGTDAKVCADVGEAVLAEALACEFPYELDSVMSCTEALPAAPRKALLNAQRPRIEALLADGGFGKKRCADQRSLVLTAVDLYENLGDAAAARQLLERAIADTRKQLGIKLTRDRNLADNLRVYLDRAGKTADLDALMPRLIAAYPDDYVYAYRHGKSLLARGKAAEALPLLEQAAGKAYGVNRLKVAQQRVLALQALKRADEARRVAGEALKANGPWFADEAQKLKALVLS